MSSAPTLQPSSPSPLTLNIIQKAVSGPAAAFRLTTELLPAGGPGTKVFPSTYSGGVYAKETRKVGDQEVNCVLLDSVQSQANRLEQSLLRAYEEEKISLPILAVDFCTEFPDIGRITTLDAPHRIADAILRDSTLPIDGKAVPFRDTPQGKAFAAATQRSAAAIFELCPTALIFGCWDSTGSQGGLGNKFARALVSEIVGLDAVYGTKTSSRIDPLGVKKVDVYKARDSWTVDADEADKTDSGVAVRFESRSGKGNPSALNHGNVTPDISKRDDDGDFLGGGVTISKAIQTTVLSLPALRRLRFPNNESRYSIERDGAAQTVLAALALTAVALQHKQGYDLRSRCLLLPVAEVPTLELVSSATASAPYQLDVEQCMKALNEAIDAAREQGFTWSSDPIILQPQLRLLDLIRKSRATLGAESAEDASNAGTGN